MGDGLDYPETFEDEVRYRIDPFDVRPVDPLLHEDPELDEQDCTHCNYQGELVDYEFPLGKYGKVYGIICSDCLDAIEREDAPEELAITLGDRLDPLTEAGLYAADASWMLQL